MEHTKRLGKLFLRYVTLKYKKKKSILPLKGAAVYGKETHMIEQSLKTIIFGPKS